MKSRIKDKQSFAIIIIMLSVFVLGACLLLSLLGPVHFDYLCVAADSNENVYLGVIDFIEVYNNNELVKKISLNNTRMFGKAFFTIIDDKLYIERSSNISVCDLDGNEIDIIEDADLDSLFEPNNIHYQTRFYRSESGDTYNLYKLFGISFVTKTNSFGETKTVFRQPIIAFFLKALMFVAFAGFAFGILVVLQTSTKGCPDRRSKIMRIPAIDKWVEGK